MNNLINRSTSEFISALFTWFETCHFFSAHTEVSQVLILQKVSHNILVPWSSKFLQMIPNVSFPLATIDISGTICSLAQYRKYSRDIDIYWMNITLGKKSGIPEHTFCDFYSSFSLTLVLFGTMIGLSKSRSPLFSSLNLVWVYSKAFQTVNWRVKLSSFAVL